MTTNAFEPSDYVQVVKERAANGALTEDPIVNRLTADQLTAMADLRHGRYAKVVGDTATIDTANLRPGHEVLLYSETAGVFTFKPAVWTGQTWVTPDDGALWRTSQTVIQSDLEGKVGTKLDAATAPSKFSLTDAEPNGSRAFVNGEALPDGWAVRSSVTATASDTGLQLRNTGGSTVTWFKTGDIELPAGRYSVMLVSLRFARASTGTPAMKLVNEIPEPGVEAPIVDGVDFTSMERQMVLFDVSGLSGTVRFRLDYNHDADAGNGIDVEWTHLAGYDAGAVAREINGLINAAEDRLGNRLAKVEPDPRSRKAKVWRMGAQHKVLANDPHIYNHVVSLDEYLIDLTAGGQGYGTVVHSIRNETTNEESRGEQLNVFCRLQTFDQASWTFEAEWFDAAKTETPIPKPAGIIMGESRFRYSTHSKEELALASQRVGDGSRRALFMGRRKTGSFVPDASNKWRLARVARKTSDAAHPEEIARGYNAGRAGSVLLTETVSGDVAGLSFQWTFDGISGFEFVAGDPFFMFDRTWEVIPLLGFTGWDADNARPLNARLACLARKIDPDDPWAGWYMSRAFDPGDIDAAEQWEPTGEETPQNEALISLRRVGRDSLSPETRVVAISDDLHAWTDLRFTGDDAQTRRVEITRMGDREYLATGPAHDSLREGIYAGWGVSPAAIAWSSKISNEAAHTPQVKFGNATENFDGLSAMPTGWTHRPNLTPAYGGDGTTFANDGTASLGWVRGPELDFGSSGSWNRVEVRVRNVQGVTRVRLWHYDPNTYYDALSDYSFSDSETGEQVLRFDCTSLSGVQELGLLWDDSGTSGDALKIEGEFQILRAGLGELAHYSRAARAASRPASDRKAKVAWTSGGVDPIRVTNLTLTEINLPDPERWPLLATDERAGETDDTARISGPDSLDRLWGRPGSEGTLPLPDGAFTAAIGVRFGALPTSHPHQMWLGTARRYARLEWKTDGRVVVIREPVGSAVQTEIETGLVHTDPTETLVIQLAGDRQAGVATIQGVLVDLDDFAHWHFGDPFGLAPGLPNGSFWIEPDSTWVRRRVPGELSTLFNLAAKRLERLTCESADIASVVAQQVDVARLDVSDRAGVRVLNVTKQATETVDGNGIIRVRGGLQPIDHGGTGAVSVNGFDIQDLEVDDVFEIETVSSSRDVTLVNLGTVPAGMAQIILGGNQDLNTISDSARFRVTKKGASNEVKLITYRDN